MNIFSQLIFPIFGMIIILLAIVAYFFRDNKLELKKIQKFSAFGLTMEVSIITGLVLGGMIFCGIGFYLNEYSYEQKFLAEKKISEEKDKSITGLTKQLETEENIINSFKTQNITYQLVLDDSDQNTPPPPAKSLTCVFHKNWDPSSDSLEYEVTSSSAQKSYKVTFKNLSLQELSDATPYIYLMDKNNKKRWFYRSFNPLTPTIFLKNK